MAKVYTNHIPAPDFMEPDGTYSHSGYDARCQKYREDTVEWLRSLGYKHKNLGKIIRFGVADGYAQYMVANGTTLIHLEEVDAYHVHDALLRGLRATDIDAMIKRDENFNALFSGSKRASI
jgi:hypothetical protein